MRPHLALRPGLLPLLLLLHVLHGTATHATEVPYRTQSRRLTRLLSTVTCHERRISTEAELTQKLLLATTCNHGNPLPHHRALCEATFSPRVCNGSLYCPPSQPLFLALRALRAAPACPLPAARLPRLRRRLDRRLAARIRAARLPLPRFPALVLEPFRDADSVVILIHGLGARAEAQLPLADMIRNRFPTTRVVIPQAPTRFVNFTNQVTTSWFNIFGDTLDAQQASAEILSAAAGIRELADVQKRVFGIPKRRMVVMGTSQGGAVMHTTYLRNRWGGAIGVSTYLPLLGSYPEEANNKSVAAPLLLFHGTDDQVVPFEFGQLSASAERSFGRTLTLKVFEGGEHRSYFFQKEIQHGVFQHLRKVFA